MTLKVGPQVAWQVVDGQAVVIDLASGQAVGLNPAGTLIWSLLESREEPEIVSAVVDRFDVDPATAQADVARFLAVLRERSILGPRE